MPRLGVTTGDVLSGGAGVVDGGRFGAVEGSDLFTCVFFEEVESLEGLGHVRLEDEPKARGLLDLADGPREFGS